MIEWFTHANEKPMTIKILKVDFRKGTRQNCGECPVARGCLRAARPLGYDQVRVTQAAVDFWRSGARFGTLARRDVPLAARVVITDFDFGAVPKSDFEPFEFEIEDLPRAQGSV